MEEVGAKPLNLLSKEEKMNLPELKKKYGENFVTELECQVLKLAQESPDFVYNPSGQSATCSYTGPARARVTDVDDAAYTQVAIGPECSGCLFGQALQRMGLDFKEVCYDLQMSCLRDLLGFGFHYDYLQKVQEKQDTGKSWGEAIKLIPSEEFTVIYMEALPMGSDIIYLTQMTYLTVPKGKLAYALKFHGIDSAVFIFEGHCKLEGAS